MSAPLFPPSATSGGFPSAGIRRTRSFPGTSLPPLDLPPPSCHAGLLSKIVLFPDACQLRDPVSPPGRFWRRAWAGPGRCFRRSSFSPHQTPADASRAAFRRQPSGLRPTAPIAHPPSGSPLALSPTVVHQRVHGDRQTSPTPRPEVPPSRTPHRSGTLSSAGPFFLVQNSTPPFVFMQHRNSLPRFGLFGAGQTPPFLATP